MTEITLGYSPCPNDTFIFYAMVHGRIDTEALRFRELLLDVETLNRKALHGDLDMTKISYHAFGHLRDSYTLLRAGGALGRGCGPLVIAKNEYTMEDLRDRKIAVPGRFTTAFLLLQLYDPAFRPAGTYVNTPLPNVFIEMQFDKIIEAVADGTVDAGLIIHESRFTYPAFGLKQIIDLGEWWEKETGLPVPLGGIIAKRALGGDTHKKIDLVLKKSVEYAFNNRSEPMKYIKEHSQELSDDVISQHINLYVNDFSLDVGPEGEKAVIELLGRAEDNGIIPKKGTPFFS